MRVPRWPSRPHPGGAFLRARRGDLDIAMPPPYDMSDAGQRQARQTVEELIQQLKPDGLDGNSREVLNNLINDWTDQDIARLSSHRTEWKAVGGILIGLAREEVARRQQRYDADYSRAQHALQALAVTHQQLTGKDLAELPSPQPRHHDPGPARSTLGRLVLPEDDGGPAHGHAGTRCPDPSRPDPSRPSANGHGHPVPADDDPAEGTEGA